MLTETRTIKVYDSHANGEPALWLEASTDGTLTLNDSNMGVDVDDMAEADILALKICTSWVRSNEPS